MLAPLRLILLAALVAFACVPAARGQFFDPALVDPVMTFNIELNEVASATRRELERAEASLKNEQWDEAIETFRRLMEENSDRVIAADYGSEVSNPFAVYIPVRDYCHMRLARLAVEAPAALALYRQRVDPLARQWLDEARRGKDAALLERIVRQLFISSYGDDALFLLGEVELERGHFAAARGAWERISPTLRTPAERNAFMDLQPARPWWPTLQDVDLDAQWEELAPAFRPTGAPGAWFVYPDTDLNLADVRARLALTSILEGSRERARMETALLARLHPDAEGAIGGRSGKLAELLASLLEQSRLWTAISPPPEWPTFAGSQERNRRAVREVDPAGRPRWVYAFDKSFQASDNLAESRAFPQNFPRADERDRPPVPVASYHPVVVGETVLFNDWRHIYALHVETGEAAVPLGVGEGQDGVIYRPQQSIGLPFDSALGSSSVLGAPRFTLNVQEDRLVARLGSPITGEAADSLTSRQQGYLMTLDLKTLKRLHEPIEPGGREWAFEGTPVTDGVRLYVAMRQSQVRAVAYVACFDMQTGQQLWRRKIGSGETLGQGRQEITHNLLTLAEGVLYYNTNLGAVAALSVPDGEVKWVTRYPRAPYRRGDARQDLRYLRDLNPCVFHKGVVISFPTDCNRIFALDAMSGQLLWATLEDSANDVAHLLGVAHDNLIAGGASLYWLNAHSGRFYAQFPPSGAYTEGRAIPDPHGRGRGVLAGDSIYWFTQSGASDSAQTAKIQVLSQQLRRTGQIWEVQRQREIELGSRLRGVPLEGANLVIAGGALLLATPQHLIAFGE